MIHFPFHLICNKFQLRFRMRVSEIKMQELGDFIEKQIAKNKTIISVQAESVQKHQGRSASVRRRVSKPAQYFPFQLSSRRFSFRNS